MNIEKKPTVDYSTDSDDGMDLDEDAIKLLNVSELVNATSTKDGIIDNVTPFSFNDIPSPQKQLKKNPKKTPKRKRGK